MHTRPRWLLRQHKIIWIKSLLARKKFCILEQGRHTRLPSDTADSNYSIDKANIWCSLDSIRRKQAILGPICYRYQLYEVYIWCRTSVSMSKTIEPLHVPNESKNVDPNNNTRRRNSLLSRITILSTLLCIYNQRRLFAFHTSCAYQQYYSVHRS